MSPRLVIGTLFIKSPAGNGEMAESSRELRAGDQVLIGRDQDLELSLVDSGVSRRHLSLSCSESSVLASDLGSTNGSFYNGVRLSSPVELKDGDKLQLGQCSIEFRFSESSEESPEVTSTMTAEMRTVSVIALAVRLPGVQEMVLELGGNAVFEGLTIWKAKVAKLIEESGGVPQHLLEDSATALWHGTQKPVLAGLALQAARAIDELARSFHETRVLQKHGAKLWPCQVALVAGVGLTEIRAGAASTGSSRLNLIGDPIAEALELFSSEQSTEPQLVFVSQSFADAMGEDMARQLLRDIGAGGQGTRFCLSSS